MGMFCPAVQDGVWENFVDLFRGHLIGGAKVGKKREVVVEFCETSGKVFEDNFARFTHYTANNALLVGKGDNQRKKSE